MHDSYRLFVSETDTHGLVVHLFTALLRLTCIMQSSQVEDTMSVRERAANDAPSNDFLRHLPCHDLAMTRLSCLARQMFLLVDSRVSSYRPRAVQFPVPRNLTAVAKRGHSVRKEAHDLRISTLQYSIRGSCPIQQISSV